MPERSFEEEMASLDRWVAELKYSGFRAKWKNELCKINELHTISEDVKKSIHQEYMPVYSEAV
jgi:hypothetical protein